MRAHAEAHGAKLGQVAQPLRAALTGRATSPGLFDVMAVLGRTKSLARLRDQVGPDAPADIGSWPRAFSPCCRLTLPYG